MEKMQFNNDDFCLYSPDSLKYITDKMEEILNESIVFYKKLFEIESFRKVVINYFDDKEKFREFVISIREDYEPLPTYATGTFDKGMINAYLKTNYVIGSSLYYRSLYMASHELFHIMYKELILDKNKQERIVWFDEGMAQLFSSEFDFILNNEEKFDKFLNNVINNTNIIPNLNTLYHGTGFKNENYDGYCLSLLAVKYLYETLGFDEFKKLIHDNNRIYELGDGIVEKAFDYFKTKRIIK